MNKKVISAVLGLGLMGSMYASAADAKAVTGLVFGLQIGYASGFDAPDVPVTPFTTSTENDSGNVNYGGFVGYDFALSKMFSVGAEVGVNYTPDLLKQSSTTAGVTETFEVNTLNIPLLITGKVVFPVGVNVFAKVGIDYQQAHYSCGNSTICPGDETYNNWNGVLAVGGGYQLVNFNFFAQYMYIFGNKLNDLSSSETIAEGILTGGVSYTLPM